jgi:hypothetical protein
VHTNTGWDHRAVEIDLNGRWYDGELRSWDQADDGSWSGIVTWQEAAGIRHIDRFSVARIRRA